MTRAYASVFDRDLIDGTERALRKLEWSGAKGYGSAPTAHRTRRRFLRSGRRFRSAAVHAFPTQSSVTVSVTSAS